MLLLNTKKNQEVKITAIKDDCLRIQLMKMGLQTGNIVNIHQIVSGGPIILSHKSQEIALGYDQLKLIVVDPIHV
jgi:Fe2+ transport system protein FeoA